MGDTAYGTAEMLAWMVDEQQIEPHAPVWEQPEREDVFKRSDFVFDEASDVFRCPGGKELRRFWREYKTPRTGITKAGDM